ncbi:MAG: hypothetical protein ACYCOU_24440 [Sulfobacillus sp.]
MPWTESGAPAIAALRAIQRSWQDFWNQEPWSPLVALSGRIAAVITILRGTLAGCGA